MNNVVEIKDLIKKFGNFTAVDGISFSIPKGCIFGFLGPNGSGKSTTIRMLCSVLTPTSGEGKVLGYDISKEPENIKKSIGYMSQRFSLYEDLTVAENLDFYAGIYGLDSGLKKERQKELIEMAGLNGKEKKLAGQLSGGWKQRLALGCALIHKPKLLVLDEPTAGVDPVSRRIFWNIIHILSGQGMTILVTTHYMDEAESCDLTGFIFNGKLLALDTPENLIAENNAGNLEDVFIRYVEQQTKTKIMSSFREMKFLKEEE